MKMTPALRAITIGTAALWGVLLVTGVYGLFFYRPTAAAAYADMEVLRGEVTLGLIVRWVHRTAAWLVLLLTAAGVIAAAVQSGWRQASPWVVLVPLTLAMSFTGYLLPWDQLALWAVTVGTNMTGFTPVFGDNVRFVLLDGVEVSTATLRTWLLIHVLLLPLLAALVVGIAARVSHRNQAAAITTSEELT